MIATQNVIDQEKMAVILQEVVGHQYGDHYYPTFSGVLRSLNYYPIGDETAEEGIASLALGLGKYIVDGGQTLRVSPYHPTQVLQTSEMETALRDTQTRFYALDMGHIRGDFTVDDGFNIKKLRVKQADQDGSLTYIASTFDPIDQVIRDGIYDGGRKVITFCGVLQQGIFPLPELLQLVQKFGAEEMRRPVEIEFACNLAPLSSPEGETLLGHTREAPSGAVGGALYLLQIRPIVDSKQVLDEDLQQIPDEQCLLRSSNSLGHGISEDVYDVVYVKTGEDFTAANNPTIASHIERINQRFLDGEYTHPDEGDTNEAPSGAVGGANYVLIGPGRWGSSDYWLGIPVKWPHISAARVIVESGLKNYHVDPSQGTHFFQNLTSFGVGYFTINTYTGDGLFQQDILDRMPAVEETEYVRHVRFDRPLKIMMDGKKQTGVVLLPEE